MERDLCSCGRIIVILKLLFCISISVTCSRIIEEYKDEMEKLANRLMSSILGSLGVTVDDIEWGQKPGNSGSKVGRGAIRLNHYPVCPEPERAMGLAAHTDTTILTILHQSNTGGLQVFREESGWINVEPSPGILVVNIGDLFHILSNGKIPSVVYRANFNHTRSRISIAYLWCGPAGNDVEIKPIPKIIGPVGQSLYRSVTWKEYLQIKYKVFWHWDFKQSLSGRCQWGVDTTPWKESPSSTSANLFTRSSPPIKRFRH
ncbi:PREDICTED: gibberellin 3-beta-dioxygenase 4-like [Camelina sativa]|uniref:Gibberellin 3-beta-dioxygenase 4-like n=1 Tax=Camelina sativa TaxID=90675 RepID=A0ABM1R309_CAMSA|nr:PREDICTED: gibberellin 3-beta-dioxygenase 4-like [Camelina sativa]